MPKTTPSVFLDANIVISAGKPPGGPEIERVVDLVEAGLVTVLTTDLTMTEVAKKHAQSDFDAIKEITQPHFRKIVEAATGVSLPALTRAQLRQQLKDTYDKSTADMFKSLKAKTLTIDDVKPSTVFDAYAAREGFFSGEGKKDQFPDAFTFEALKREASKENPVIIVSNDADFEGPVEAAEHVSLVKSLPELFAALGLQMEAPQLDAFLAAHDEELVERVNQELNEWGLIGDEEDSEIDEITVSSVEVGKLTAFKPAEEGGSILVVGKLNVQALVSYTHPDWVNASYDSEDGTLYPHGDVSGETEVEVVLDISMSITVDENGDPEEIDELSVRDIDSQYVTLHPYEHWK